ncbi:ATP-binding protein [Terriglobus sp. 2YAB30_2]|uniref:sensor histidine kinase n=1 Tax=Terriglobus sp. 2YAB30_2 TaxID=3233023 RepID=UPI003F9CD5E8
MAITIALLSCGIYLAAVQGVRRVADQELNAGINGIEAFLRHKLDIKQMDNLGEELREHAALLPRNRMFRAIDQTGTLIYQPDQMAMIPRVQLSEGATAGNLKVGSRSYRTMSRHVHVGPYLFVLQVAVDQTEYHELLTGFAWLLVLITPLAGLFAAGTGYWMGGRALLPIQEITRATNSIDANNLERRLTITGTGDELDRLSETINGMLDRIAGSYERIKQFTADASHELRTPTAVVKASAEVLLMGDSQPDTARRTLNHIILEADYMTRVIEDLLTLARSSANDNLPPSELFELGESLRALEPRIVSLAHRKNIQVRTNFEDDLLVLKGNQSVVERVMMILVDNAVRYTPAGGSVQIQMWRNGLMGGFSVVDDGIGIPAELQSKVFERFYRVDVVRTSGDGGSGLGLSIAKSLTEAYGGSITLTSEVGKGTNFTVSFPCAEIAAEAYPYA